MVFAHSGFKVDQQRIVREAYGGITNLPAQGWQVTQSLNRSWVDDDERSFDSRITGLYDADKGVVGITMLKLLVSYQVDSH
jgi:hypothetical protein